MTGWTAILRRVPPGTGQPAEPAWYLCDLKVHPDHRGRLLMLRLMRALAASTRTATERGYAVSMGSGDGTHGSSGGVNVFLLGACLGLLESGLGHAHRSL